MQSRYRSFLILSNFACFFVFFVLVFTNSLPKDCRFLSFPKYILTLFDECRRVEGLSTKCELFILSSKAKKMFSNFLSEKV